ncbi:MAG: hypothetical protein LBV29_05935 [Azoarcus sp.]|jgi:hypothetical protein|nr:hypothetical protein [Azoarcus sp.]
MSNSATPGTLSYYCLEAKKNFYANEDSYVGSERLKLTRPANWGRTDQAWQQEKKEREELIRRVAARELFKTNCTMFVLDVLIQGYEGFGKNNNSIKIAADNVVLRLKRMIDGHYSGIPGEEHKHQSGMYLAKFLVEEINNEKLRWKAHYWNPDVNEPKTRNNPGEHRATWVEARDTKKYYGRNPDPTLRWKIPLDGAVVGYNRQDNKNNLHNTQAFNRLRNVKFCVGVCEGGQHIFIMSEGVVYEAGWAQLGEAEDILKERPFGPYLSGNEWDSGILLMPPDSGYVSRSIDELKVEAMRNNNSFLKRLFRWN